MDDTQMMVGRHVLDRLELKLEQALNAEPLDIDFLEFVCRSEMSLIASLSPHIHFPKEVLEGLLELVTLINQEMDNRRTTIVVDRTTGERGRPKLIVHQEHIEELLEMELSVPCISKLLGISKRTLFRRLRDWGLSVMDTYSNMSDDDLDQLISQIKDTSPNLGHRMVKDRLKALGYRVQWTRVFESMHRVDALGILQRMTRLGCVVRKNYSAESPLSLLHIDTNYRLIRYGIVIFGGIDGYSMKVLYLRAANNNKARTALEFFLEAVHPYGCPSRVRGGQRVENVDIARHMFATRGCGRGSFISDKTVHDQRIERLWRDVWNAVSNVYYDVLHNLEEDGFLDPTDTTHIFCAQYVFLSRIQNDLDTFLDGWNNRSLCTEGNRSPNQLWVMGMGQANTSQSDNAEGFDIPDMEIPPEAGLHVPECRSPLNTEQLEGLREMFEPNAPSTCFGADIYRDVLHYVVTVLEEDG